MLSAKHNRRNIKIIKIIPIFVMRTTRFRRDFKVKRLFVAI